MPNRIFKFVIGTFGAIGVSFGAFGAHALKAQLIASGHLETWQTAVLYQMIHTVALLTLSAPNGGTNQTANRLLTATIWSWVCGIIFFSGSLYALALGGPHWLGPVTPLGGLAFIIGWGCLATSGLKSSKPPAKP